MHRPVEWPLVERTWVDDLNEGFVYGFALAAGLALAATQAARAILRRATILR